MDKESPIVSVIMTVYNAGRFLRPALDSLLNQTFTDFELIVVEDASTDDSKAILQSYQDNRLICHYNPVNLGLTSGLSFSPNKAIAISRGKYIARQDADDLSLPGRLAAQVEFLENNPLIGLVGCWVDMVNTQDLKVGESRPPIDPALLKWQLAFRNCFTQSSVMFRRSVIESLGPYSEEMKHAEDYELWWRISTRFQVTHLPQVYVKRRLTPGGIVHEYPQAQLEYTIKVIQRALSYRINAPIDYDSAANIDSLERGLALPDIHAAIDCWQLIVQSYRKFWQLPELNSSQKSLIKKDAAEKLFILAGNAWSLSRILGIRIALSALSLSPRLPKFQTLTKLRHWVG